jgi:hypothetical protein
MTGLKGWQATGALASQDPHWSPVIEGRFRLGVTGSRSFGDRDLVQQALLLLNIGSRVTVVHGAATGLDTLVQEVAGVLFPAWDFDPFPAAWGRECDAQCAHGGYRPRRRDGSEWCPAAGPVRNEKMATSGLDLLLAFQGHKGTENMIRCAKAAGVRVLRVEA